MLRERTSSLGYATLISLSALYFPQISGEINDIDLSEFLCADSKWELSYYINRNKK